MPAPVRTAGGVVWRPADGGIEICVVHRPYRVDWSLPKGHLDGSEHTLVAAVREVREETGVVPVPQMRLPQVAYVMPDGRPKTVDFWLMRATDGPSEGPQDPAEVDEVAWLSPAAAVARLTYADDRRLVEHVAALPPVTAVTLLLRHAKAGKRKDVADDDALRPIDERGRAQAETLAAVAETFAPGRLIAASPLRCRQTLEPLAARLGGTAIAVDDSFSEPATHIKAAADRLTELREGPLTTVCSQGKVIPGALALLDGATDTRPYRTPKGTGWVLSWSGDQLAALSRI